jgi:hypothetical protein
MYPPNLDAFHQIHLDRSQRAIAAAEAHRRADRSARRHQARSSLGRLARRLAVLRGRASVEPRPARAGEA